MKKEQFTLIVFKKIVIKNGNFGNNYEQLKKNAEGIEVPMTISAIDANNIKIYKCSFFLPFTYSSGTSDSENDQK